MFLLLTIPLKNAFQAVLWLTEKEYNVSDEDIKGWWNVVQPNSKAVWPQYTQIVQALGYNYFENSIYRGVTTSVNLTNEFDGDILITENNDVVTQERLTNEALGEELSEWLHYETDKELSRYAHTDFQPKEDYVVKTTKIKTGVSKLVDSLTDDEFLDKAVALCKKIDSQKANITFPENSECQSLSQEQLNALAHTKLLFWLINGDVQVEGTPVVIHSKNDLFKTPTSTAIFKTLAPELWRRYPLPHYEIDSLHFGESHKLYYTQQLLQGNAGLGHTLKAEHEFWFNNLRVHETSFIQKIAPLITRHFPTPEKASIKQRGKHYIINFGHDVDVKVKASIGLTALKILILHTNAKSNDSEGIAATLLDDLKNVALGTGSLEDYYYDVVKGNEYTNEDDEDQQETNYSKVSENNLKIRVITDKLKNAVKEYWLLDKDERSLREQQCDLIKQLSHRVDVLNHSDNILPMVDELLNDKHNQKTKEELLSYVLPLSREDDIEKAKQRKLRNSLWKGITTALDNIQYDCPHFYYHMRGLGAGSLAGAARQHHGNTLIYQTEHQIKWDLTSLDTGKL